DRGQPHDPDLPADLPGGHDPDPPAHRVPPRADRRRRARGAWRSDRRLREAGPRLRRLHADHRHRRRRRTALDLGSDLHARRNGRRCERSVMTAFRTRRTITTGDIVAYSRRGNYHSDPDTAQRIGLPGLVAQGVQVAGPAYGALLDAWGDEFLEHG